MGAVHDLSTHTAEKVRVQRAALLGRCVVDYLMSCVFDGFVVRALLCVVRTHTPAFYSQRIVFCWVTDTKYVY